MKKKKHMIFDYNDVNFNAPPGLFKSYAIIKNSVKTE